MTEDRKTYPRRSGTASDDSSYTADSLDDKFIRFKADILDEFRDILTTQHIPKSLDEESYGQLKEVIKNSVEEAITTFSQKYDERLHKLEKMLTNVVESSVKQAEEMEHKTLSLTKENEALRLKVDCLEEEIEERTNRSLRKTLIFKNIPQNGKETWDEPTEKVAEAIHKASKGDISFDEAHDMLERCHRGKPRRAGGNAPKYPPPVYAAIDDWRNSERIKDCFFNRPANFDVFVDQKYGKRTTWRRNQALKKRKDLKAKGDIVSGYVKYPAVLMVKKRHGLKYEEFDNFSKMPVVFEERSY